MIEKEVVDVGDLEDELSHGWTLVGVRSVLGKERGVTEHK